MKKQVEWMARPGLYEKDCFGHNAVGMLLAEPTSGVVWNANRGAISLRVRVMGQAAHVGLQHQGENAFERMHRVVGKLQELKREVEQRATKFEMGAPASSALDSNSDSARATTSTLGPGRNSILMLGGESGG